MQKKVLGLLIVLLAGCLGSKPEEAIPPSERYGHRYTGREGPGEMRTTVEVTPPDPNRRYFYYPVMMDSLYVRVAPFDPDMPAAEQKVQVELLVTGSLPNACSEMHDIRQVRSGNIIDLEVEMRRPQDVLCENVEWPYRLYVPLRGRYGLGNYTLKINGTTYAFVVEPPDES